MRRLGRLLSAALQGPLHVDCWAGHRYPFAHRGPAMDGADPPQGECGWVRWKLGPVVSAATRRLLRPEHQIGDLVLWSHQARRATCCQTVGLATAARNCDHIATMPRMAGGDGCSTRINKMAVDQHQWGMSWGRKDGRGRLMQDYGSGGGDDLAM